MKVICINGGRYNPESDPAIKDDIIEGEIYTVRDTGEEYVVFYGRTLKYYEFYEIQGAYEQSLFIPISEIDETELANQREELQTV